MNDYPGGLVDNEQVLVLMDDLKASDRFGLEGALAPFGNLDHDLFASGEPVALRSHVSVHEHVSLCQHAFRGRPRADAFEPSEEAVESLAGRRQRDGDANAPTGHANEGLARERGEALQPLRAR
jgi:hypothetical protein